MSTLNAKRVSELLVDCLFLDDENQDGAMIGRGIIHDYAFHPVRLEAHREEVAAMLADLPDEFHQSKGGGWSFLNACMDRDGNHWAEHHTIEQLLALGGALGMAKILMPREMWKICPGGMPYFSVNPPVKHEVAP
jgi:hypothetical protein